MSKEGDEPIFKPNTCPVQDAHEKIMPPTLCKMQIIRKAEVHEDGYRDILRVLSKIQQVHPEKSPLQPIYR